MSYDDKQALLKAYSEESKRALEEIEFGHTYDGKLTQKLKEIDLKYEKLAKELFQKEKSGTNTE